jgi:probable HAF family extracellular repeat protein
MARIPLHRGARPKPTKVNDMRAVSRIDCWTRAWGVTLLSLGISYNFTAQAQQSPITDAAAQDSAPQNHPAKHHHYQLVQIPTFGGPASDLNTGNDGVFSVNFVNNQGALAGWADTAAPDPFPSYCFYDCYVTHAFRWQDGVMTDLGALADGVSSQALWISASGLIAGVSENGEIDPLISGFPQNRAVLWENGTIVDLGTLGGYESFANAVNSRGQVVGSALNTIPDPFSQGGFPTQQRAFLWERGAMQDLGTLGSGNDAIALFINEQGQVVGWSYTSSAPNTSCPSFLPLATGSFIWDKKNGMTDLGTLGGTCTIAVGLNNNGTVVGFYVNDNQIEHGFLWENGSIHDLGGTLGGDYTQAVGINDHGVIAGTAFLAGNTTYHAALWRQVGHITDLGTLAADQCSQASSINAKTQIVGVSITDDCTFDNNSRAFLWEGGSIFDLNTLIPAGSALHLQWARGINDRGEIAGSGLDAEENVHAFVLIPCDENHPDVEGCDYSMVDASAATRESAASVMQKPTTTAPRTPALYGSFNDVRRMFPGRLGFGRFVGGPQQVALSGAVAATSAPIATLSPTSETFSTEAIGTTSAAQTVTLKNTGTTSLQITAIAIAGANAADFAQTHNCATSLAAGTSCSISVTFKPTASGTRTAALSVTDNSAGSPQKVGLTGIGTTAKLSPTSLSLGTIVLGTSSPAKPVTLTNIGTTTLTISGIAITGTNAGDFAQTHTCGSSLAAGASCSVSVTFNPTASGTRTAALSVTDYAAGSPQTVTLSGMGAVAKLTITSGTPPPGTVGKVYDVHCILTPFCQIVVGFPLAASGGVPPYSWTWTPQPGSSLPPGLSIIHGGAFRCSSFVATVICGTPTIAGSYNVTVKVTDSASPPANATANYTIDIN